MSVWTNLISRIAGWRPRHHRLNDLDREIESHLEVEADEQQEAGLSLEKARDAARRVFGNTALVGEDVRAVWIASWLDALSRDVRYATRTLIRNPRFAVVAVLTLALGIGANTAIFTAIDALMFTPLPFPQSDQLVRLYATKNGIASPRLGSPSPPDGATTPMRVTVSSIWSCTTCGARTSASWTGRVDVWTPAAFSEW
jgi:hypothetical protein